MGPEPWSLSSAMWSHHMQAPPPPSCRRSPASACIGRFGRAYLLTTSPKIRDIMKRDMWLLWCYPQKVVLPKFEFLCSKGASPSDIVHMVSMGPRFLHKNLEIPAYEYVM